MTLVLFKIMGSNSCLRNNLYLFLWLSHRCLKKYCNCFISGKQCNDRCTCLDCHNRGDVVVTNNSEIISFDAGIVNFPCSEDSHIQGNNCD